MWKQLFEFGKQVLALKQQVAKNTKEIEELRIVKNYQTIFNVIEKITPMSKKNYYCGWKILY
jgi:hypothetical protein